ncbi:helix-turn-helix domain-containing protein [Actinomadura sp. K4S16]|uniref:helix-turn-helix domain-containing protein n=1 Tax=Actinomadura sp. K4S16 TaxID=1316147 RepID=UPI0011EC9F86|nr:helix-turn-helix domain-containing protein [Actinomadura sp. K4S16]
MRELVGRLEALDPDAGAALRVITFFDQLIERRAGLENVVRGAAVLSGHPAVLVDTDRGVRIRVTPDGTRTELAPSEPQAGWCRLTVDSHITVWLEHPGPPGPVEAMVMERAAMSARTILDRTRGRARPQPRHDAELVEVLLDAAASVEDRSHAAKRLRLKPSELARVVAEFDGPLHVGTTSPESDSRAGVGPAVPLLELPKTVAAARAAAQFTAQGTPTDPGPRIVYAEDLGGLILLAAAADAPPDTVPDIAAVERAAATAPWMLPTLDALASGGSLRTAAAALKVHHSTLQERTTQAERLLGWPLRDHPGRVRLTVALMLRRLHRNKAQAS